MAIVNDYIGFLNDFYEWEMQNNLTCIQERIFMRILRRVNASGWNEWIKVSNKELMLETHMTSEVTFRNNRDKLIKLGLIEYRSGKKSEPSSYKLNTLTKKETVHSVSKNIKRKNVSEKIHVKNSDELNDSNKINNELENANSENIFMKIPLTNSEEYSITYDLIEEYKTLYPNVDIEQEIRKIKAWTLSNPQRRKTKRGVLRFVNNWLSKSQDKGSNVYNNSRFDNGTFFRNVGGESNYGNPNYHEYPE